MDTFSFAPGFRRDNIPAALDGANNMPNGLAWSEADENLSPRSAQFNGQPPLRTTSPAPLPLPNFVFPRPATVSQLSSSSAPSSFSRPAGRRPLSATSLTVGSAERNFPDGSNRNSLPAFSFGMQSPPLSPQAQTIPARVGAHKRVTSEFVGEDATVGSGSGSLSNSPTKSDGIFPPPPALTGAPSGGRRGHAHRRSAAISTNDLTMILKPSSPPLRGNSAPNSPAADKSYQHTSFPGLDAEVVVAKTEKSPPKPVEPLPIKTLRGRVGFNDEIQIIPRPLSLVSDDSSSTVRPGHSVSNSMSSIISAGMSSPLSKDQSTLAPESKMVDSRPRTAEPILNRDGTKPHEVVPKRRGSLPLLSDAVTASGSVPSTPKSAKKWSFFGHEAVSGESSPKSRPASVSSLTKESQKAVNPLPPGIVAAGNQNPLPSLERTASRRSSISRKPTKKKKKVRSWAGSILSRKSRQHSQKQKLSRRSPTPPLRAYTPMDENFNDTQGTFPEIPEIQTDFASWKPRKMPPQEESMSPVIDLDAALGPFNTPSSFGEDWDNSQRGSTRKRVMHSAAGWGGFAGPGMHYHRRAESAPEFENPRFGLHRLGSSSTMGMEDVFEEDEDEEWEDAKASSDHDSTMKAEADDDENSLGIDIKVVDSDGTSNDNSMDFEEAEFQRSIKRKGSGLSEGDRWQMSSSRSGHSTTSLVDPIQEETSDAIEIVDDSFPSRPDSRAQSSDSTATPPFRPHLGKDLAPVDIQPLALQPPYLSPASLRSISQSSLPSPRSPFSYDTQRISTAPSSIADENAFQSLLLGEPGPEVRRSVDDVPSLTSSDSTTTRDSNIYPGAGNPQFRGGQRSTSLSAAAVGHKRSSIASLSRLISSSHGEKSKLSIELRAPGTSDGLKKEKTSKTKRISRLMQFWKPKESSS